MRKRKNDLTSEFIKTSKWRKRRIDRFVMSKKKDLDYSRSRGTRRW